ncbi:MAG TPA: NmrA/HSCARG family protein [Thermoanaerobaculia bacterium]|jgi:uncharacterized protein YbjT (DUF2867 family)|nr:NmrA/HSCARG family protein [Thermoanaerobaculia bacterium]
MSITTDRKLILVTGATGAQGGGVTRHLLSRDRFAVRALTRDPESERARELERAGAEVVQGDLADRASLRSALKDCYGVFGVTNYWEHFAGERRHGMNLVNAVAGSEVEHFVFSTLPPAFRRSGGKLPVPHFDIKAELEDYARGLGLPATFVHVAFYYENFLGFLPFQRGADGAYHFGLPQGETPLAAVAAEDVGGVVAAVFESPAEFLGRTVGIVGDDRVASEYAASMTGALGTPVVYDYIPREVFAGFGFPGADDLANMFEFNRKFIPNRQEDLETSRALYSGMQSFEAWLGPNSERLRAVFQQ